jgi:hypothetical protein
MRRSVLLLGAVLLAAAIPKAVHAQTIVSMGKGWAHDCFVYAKAGVDPYDGVEVCNLSIANEALTVKDRAATYDNRGVMLDQLCRLYKAADVFQRSLALDPKLGDPHVNLGSVLI